MVNMQKRNPNVFFPASSIYPAAVHILLMCLLGHHCVHMHTSHIHSTEVPQFQRGFPLHIKKYTDTGIHFLGKFSCRQWSLCAHCWTKPTAWIFSSFHNHDIIPQLVSLHPNCHTSIIVLVRLHWTSARAHVHALCSRNCEDLQPMNTITEHGNYCTQEL